MTMQFEFATASRIIFGAGKRAELPALIAEYGARRVLCVIGGSQERVQPILDLIASTGAETAIVAQRGEPDLTSIRAGLEITRAFAPDMIVAIGGGSAIDTAKALAGLEANPGDVLDYLEIIGAGKALSHPVRLPVIAMPTTAGTGSEVTRNAVIASPEHRLKVSLRHKSMLPAVALVDPELTYGLPAAATAYTGMDALVQLIEPLLSPARTPVTTALCLDGLTLGAGALLTCVRSPSDAKAREAMACASLFGGMALANAKLGAVHGFAGVIGGMFDAPHGALCARLLAPVLEVNRAALSARQPESEALRWMQAVTEITSAESALPDMSGDKLLDWAWGMIEALAIPPLSQWGVTEADIPDIAAKSATSNSMKGNPIALTQDELESILRAAL